MTNKKTGKRERRKHARKAFDECLRVDKLVNLKLKRLLGEVIVVVSNVKKGVETIAMEIAAQAESEDQ